MVFFSFRRTVSVWLLLRAPGTRSCSGLTALSQRTTSCWRSLKESWQSPTTSGLRTLWSPTGKEDWMMGCITWWGLRGLGPTPPSRLTTIRRLPALQMVREEPVRPCKARPRHDKYEHKTNAKLHESNFEIIPDKFENKGKFGQNILFSREKTRNIKLNYFRRASLDCLQLSVFVTSGRTVERDQPGSGTSFPSRTSQTSLGSDYFSSLSCRVFSLASPTTVWDRWTWLTTKGTEQDWEEESSHSSRYLSTIKISIQTFSWTVTVWYKVQSSTFMMAQVSLSHLSASP